jgi:hypothetical protein
MGHRGLAIQRFNCPACRCRQAQWPGHAGHALLRTGLQCMRYTRRSFGIGIHGTGRPQGMSERETDQLLVERAQAGDERAFEVLFAKYQRKVARLLVALRA